MLTLVLSSLKFLYNVCGTLRLYLPLDAGHIGQDELGTYSHVQKLPDRPKEERDAGLLITCWLQTVKALYNGLHGRRNTEFLQGG